MRWRNSCGRMSPTRCVAPLVWPLTWQSKQVTPRLARSLRRSSVWLNCCCGNGVTSSRSPSSCLGLRMSLNSSKKLSIVTSLPCETSPRFGPRGQKDRRRKLRQQVVGQVEVEIEPRQVAAFLLLDLVDVELGKQHAAFRMIGGCGSGRKPGGKEPLRPDVRRASSRPSLSQVDSLRQLGPRPRLASACRGSFWRQPAGLSDRS